jgi:hypothetical protein
MSYYTRVLSKRRDCVRFDDLVAALAKSGGGATLVVKDEDASGWTDLLLSKSDGEAIAVLDRAPVVEGALGQEEIDEFLDGLDGGKPDSATGWLRDYLPSVRTIYAFQHLSGSQDDEGFEALQCVKAQLFADGDAILQADGEGFSNEDGYGILWQFPENVSGPYAMAVLAGGKWSGFEMDLENAEHRSAFLEGRVPDGVAVIE